MLLSIRPFAKGMTGLLIVALVAMAVGCSNDSEAQQPPDQKQSATKDANKSAGNRMLVDRDQLHKMLEQEDVRVLDARVIDEYLTAHVPGAVRVDATAWTTQALAENGLKDEAFWAKAIGDLGIDKDTKVVVYGNSPTTAARVWWHLKYAGVPDVMLLDGGWDLWNVGGKPTEIEPNEPQPKKFTPKFDKSMLVEKESLKNSLAEKSAGLVVLDTRTVGEYRGKTVRGPRGGHLPGAVHLEWQEFLDVNNRFKSKEEIQKMLKEKGIEKDSQIVTHCQTGGRASAGLFALRMAGFDNAANYYCGWSEWSPDEEAPVEK